MSKVSTIKNNQSGDTIVEVLIAMVIMATVVIGAYQISNMSLRQIRMAQERTEAQEIARHATERLDVVYSKNKSGPNLVANGYFCINLDDVDGYGVLTSTNLDPANRPGTDEAQCTFGLDKRYLLSIKWDGVYGFETTVTWDSIGSVKLDGVPEGRERLQINYKVDAI